jgi:8-oxo-dGTP pyrophosphatase MutT (NUDIX family)
LGRKPLGEALFREHGQQVAALCWRTAGRSVEILLVTSLNSKRWIIPKGWAEAGMTLAENAAREAFEEAGVTGLVETAPIGTYHYLKQKRDGGGVPCRADVFALKVTRLHDEWPERGTRRMEWVTPEQAAARVTEPGLREILRGFQAGRTAARRHAG